jgi:thermitase
MGKRILIFLLLFIFQFGALFVLPSKLYALESSKPDEVSDQLIIKFKKTIPLFQKLLFTNLYLLENKGKIEKDNAEIVKVKSGRLMDVLSKIIGDFRVEYAETDYKAKVMETTNDPGLVQNLQWGLNKIQVSGNGISAWNYAKSNSSVSVAILDTGIDQNHQDLTGKIVKNYNCTTSSTFDDLYGHGTHVAGIVGALTNNGIGVAGVGYNVSLINAKVLDDSGSGYYSWIANCLYWAADNGAKVINLSLGGSTSNLTLQNAVNYAVSKGVLIVAAAGNSGNSIPIYPANYPNVISVAATDSTDKKASFSSYGTWVDVAAPGVSIYSTLPNHSNSIGILNYGYLSGTSMATPHVSGLAGLMIAINGDSLKVKKMIEDGADHVTGTSVYWANGRINALNSVNLAIARIIITPTPTVTLTPTPTVNNTPTPTSTPIPIIISNTPTPTKTVIPTPTPRSLRCRINPRYCF